MRYFFINEHLPADIRTALSVYGECIPLPPFSALPAPVSAHPDMLIANIGGTLIVHNEYQAGQKILLALGIPFVLSHMTVENVYPNDVRLNCFTVGKSLFSGKSISEEAIVLAKEKKLRTVFVRQGYTKCAAAIAGGVIATADKSIAKAAKNASIPTLLLCPEHIGIEVYDTGFIGGASVLLDDKTLGFFGDITLFSQYEALRAFFGNYGIRLVSLGKDPLFDYGGAVSFDSRRA